MNMEDEMNIAINADWPETIASLVAYRRSINEFCDEFVDGEPSIDAFFMALNMSSAAEKMARALGKEYMAKHPGPIKRFWLNLWKR